MRTLELIRFDEILAAQRPRGAIRGLDDLNVAPPYWQTPDQIRELVGGMWKAGWSLNEPSGHLAPLWGPDWIANGNTRLYGAPGYADAGDLAIGFATNGGQWYIPGGIAGGPFDVGAGDDLAILGVAKWIDVTTSYGGIVSRVGGAFSNGWAFAGLDGSNYGLFVGAGGGGVGAANVGPGTGQPGGFNYGDWHLFLGAMSRTTAKIRFTTINLRTGVDTTSGLNAAAAVSASVVADVTLGASAWVGANTNYLLSSLYIAHGPKAAAGIPDNLLALANVLVADLQGRPAIVDGAAGRGRSFVALSRKAYEAVDVTPGQTLATRDASVQALVRFDLAEQAGAMRWSLAKTGGSNGVDDAGIASVETIAGDGYIEFMAADGFGGGRCIGLSTSVSSAFGQIDYMLAVEGLPGGNINVWENGASGFGGGSIAGWSPGDVLRIERVGTAIKYSHNGVVFYTSATPSSGALLIDVRFFTVTSFLTRLRLVDAGVPKGITWKSITNMTATPVIGTGGGTIYARGKDGTVSEYDSGGIELRVVNASANIGELAWFWQATGGGLKRQVGGQFTIPPSGEILLTATRRWVSSSEVVLRYYAGDQLLNEVTSTDGDIAGGTTGTTQIGGRMSGHYPRSAAAMTAATRPGTIWSHGWLFDETSGNLNPSFGSIAFTPVSSPTYDTPGPRAAFGEVDRAVGFDSVADAFSAGDNFDVGAGDDLIIAWSSRQHLAPGVDRDFLAKYGGGNGWLMYEATAAGGAIFVFVNDGSGLVGSGLPQALIGAHHVGIAVAERATGQVVLAICTQDGRVAVGTPGNIAGKGAFQNAIATALGANGVTGNGPNLSTKHNALWIGVAPAAAAGMSTNIVDSVRNLAATVFGTYGDFFDGVIDELRVCDYELAPEEIAATWRRLTVEQPNGYQLVRELHPPGFPISADPSSRVQRETNLWGQALGYATAQAENVRANILPDRAYGDTLVQWENIVKQPAKPGDSLDTRRARVVGRLRQHAGVSIPGVGEATKGLVGTAPANLEVMAFPQELVDHYEYPAVWETGGGAAIAKSGGGGTWDAGTASTETIAGDGFVEAVATSTTTDLMIGLSDTDANVNFNTINFAAFLRSNGTIEVYESGVVKGNFGAYAVGDVIRVERVGTTIRYRKNGVVIYPSAQAATAPLLVDVSIFTFGASIANVRFYAVEDTAIREVGVTWKNVTNVTVTPARYIPYRGGFLKKTSADATWGNSGASSEQRFTGDGYVETTIVETNKERAIGLSTVDANQNYTSIGYMLDIANDGNLYIYEGGVGRGNFGAYAAGNVVRVERVGSTVFYKKNGVTLYTSTVPSSGSLLVDTALFNIDATLQRVEFFGDGARILITWVNCVGVQAHADSTQVQGASGEDLQYFNYAKNWRGATQPISSATWLRTTSFQTQNRDYAAAGFGAHLLTKVEPITLPNRGEVGIAFYDEARENIFALGLRNDAGTYRIVTERWTKGVSAGVTLRAVTALQAHWLHLYVQAPLPPARTTTIGVNQGFGGQPTENDWQLSAEWSTTSRLSGYTGYTDANTMISARFQTAVLYARSFGGTLAGALNAYFDETRLFTPYGDRSLHFYVYRPPSLAGAPDPIGAEGVVEALRHANTIAGFTQSRALLYDTDGHGYDRGPLGGY